MQFSFERDKDTICALSTPAGVGGIAVIRLSGAKSYNCLREMSGSLPETPESHKIYYTTLKTTDSSEKIDEVVVSYFAHGKSFTGEEVCEISCHGSPFIVSWILQELKKSDLRMAEPGEFTYRAFMNGKIDLTQAEATLSLIESHSKSSARTALRQLKGDLSKKLSSIVDDITWVAAQTEANIDYAAEDIVVADNTKLLTRLEKAQKTCKELLDSYENGRQIKEGIKISLLGEPNVGKSSLLNALIDEDKAIVTNQPGTTRDVIEASLNICGTRVSFSDTAGMRETNDEIEKIGIDRTKKSAQESDYVFYVFDAEKGLTEEALNQVFEIPAEKIFLVANKVDKVASDKGSFLSESSSFYQQVVKLPILKSSAMTNEGVSSLRSTIEGLAQKSSTETSAVLTQARHFESMGKALERIEQAKKAIQDEASEEFVAFELKEAVVRIHEVLGIVFDDQIMDRVFSDFCLGK